MPRLYDLLFASSNRNKYSEAKQILGSFGINLGFFRFEPVEIQSDSILDIARQKALDAYAKCKRPVMVEDAGLSIDGLGGFPGPYSSYVLKTVGNRRIVRLVGANRRAKFVSVVAFCDGPRPRLFEGVAAGTIARVPRGRGWGYDPIFVPSGRNRTYAQMNDKNKISHRFRALEEFSIWFERRQQSSGR